MGFFSSILAYWGKEKRWEINRQEKREKYLSFELGSVQFRLFLAFPTEFSSLLLGEFGSNGVPLGENGNVKRYNLFHHW